MAGLYIHIPFCRKKCSYCDFHFSTTFSEYRKRMVDAICNELKERSGFLQNSRIETIYFGGGTPSILNYEELTLIMDTIHESFSVTSDPEVTLEANPEDITPDNLDLWKSKGINRLSIGLQSFKQEDLDWMNRAHTMEQSYQCVPLAIQHGFKNITVDLIYGLPGLKMKEWRSHIQTVLDLGVPHVSAYCLTIEPRTALNNWVTKGKIVPQGEEEQIEQFNLLVEELQKNDFEQYEISNFARRGYGSKHNSSYWKGIPYLGVGPSAHSFNGRNRYWNVSNNMKYMQAIEKGETYIEQEVLSDVNRFNEKILTGLRTSYGVSLDELDEIRQRSLNFDEILENFIHEGWIDQMDNIIRLTKEGKLRADYIASELFID